MANRAIFKSILEEWSGSNLCRDWSWTELEEKIAEGGQAEIFTSKMDLGLETEPNGQSSNWNINCIFK